MKKRKILILSTLSILGLSSLVGCNFGEGTTTNNVPTAIRIVESSIGTQFVQNQVVDYSNLRIEVLNKESVLQTLKYSENSNSITYTDIVTSEIGSNFDFTVTYTYQTASGAPTTFTDTMKYSVVSASDPSSMELINWNENATWTTFNSRKNAASGEMSIDNNNFISDEGEFRIGTVNSVSLMPELWGMSDVGFVIADSLPANDVTVTITSGAASYELSSYFEEADIQKLLSVGEVNFKDELDETLPRKITLTFSLDAEKYDTAGSFKPINYDITIVDLGYNITSAKELILFDNVRTIEEYKTLKEEVLGVEELTDARFTYDNFVIFGDVSIGFADIPSYLIYNSEDFNLQDDCLVGSLIDWEYLYERSAIHPHTEGATSVNVYGNYNRISTAADFPYVLSESRRGDGTIQIPDTSKADLSTHTALFGTDERATRTDGSNVLADDYAIRFEDLAATGNQGVGSSQDTDIPHPNAGGQDIYLNGGGVMFSKNTYETIYDNVNINNFFTIHINNGAWNANTLNKVEGTRPALNVVDSRLTDCYSTMLFNYSESVINVEHSALYDAGGFLIINQANAYNGTQGKNRFEGANEEYIKGTDVNIDDTTILENYVTGQGGWFHSYNVESVFASALKVMISDNLEKQNKSLFVTKNGISRSNAIILTMNSEVTTAGALEPGMKCRVVIGGKTYMDYEGGKTEFETALNNYKNALENAPATAPAYLAKLLTKFYTTQYGAAFFSKYPTAGLMTVDENGDSYYAIPYTLNPSDPSVIDIVPLETIINYVAGIPVQQNDFLLDQEKFTGDYVTVYYSFGANPTSPTTEVITRDLLSYQGSQAYGLIMGLFDTNN